MENQEDFIARTVPHEVAHLIDYIVNPQNFQSSLTLTRTGRYKRSKRDLHGADFKFIMTTVLGCNDGDRCHTYDTSNAAVKRRRAANYIWICKEDPSIEMELGPKRHRKQQIGLTTYRPRGVPKGLTYEYSHRVGEPKPIPTIPKKETPAEERHRKLIEGGWALAADVKKEIKAEEVDIIHPTLAANIEKPAGATSHNRPTGKQSKLDICRGVWDNNPNEDRQGMISKFVGAGCTTAGAATYYSKIKKEKVRT